MATSPALAAAAETGAGVEILVHDVRYAPRALVQARGFSMWVVLSLSIGMAVAIAAIAFINTMLFEPFPGVAEQPRLVRVTVSRNCGSAAAPRVAIAELGTLADFNERTFAAQLWLARAARAIGIVGLLLATAGLYGVASYVVAIAAAALFMAAMLTAGALPALRAARIQPGEALRDT